MSNRIKIFLFFALLSYLPASAQVYEAWVARYNGTGNSSGIAYALAIDNSGNVYVTGISDGGLVTGYDYATIKYAPNGDTLWVRRYNGGDAAYALAVDDSGNVYVTGYGSGTYTDYVTIKYSSLGDTLWVRRYSGPGNFFDYASALAVDKSGNVYVTGSSPDSVTSYDYATIKYSSFGDTLWVRRYNGPGNADDLAKALAVDDSGNVYVTGGSYGSGTFNDYATIKYSSAGDTLWVRRYNGPGNLADGASALAVDDSGNVYVTGGSERDYATIKYAPNGDTVWVRRYKGPGFFADHASALAVDGSGNVYVTGYSYGSGTFADYATIKYSSAG
ncbi:MAG TPA: SBBP repeat-containing protein, partial [candidate division Zixibacteria bacterium]|nr:SBBP repeat-containing protein [candidate division Zixibacteria bacterium]